MNLSSSSDEEEELPTASLATTAPLATTATRYPHPEPPPAGSTWLATPDVDHAVTGHMKALFLRLLTILPPNRVPQTVYQERVSLRDDSSLRKLIASPNDFWLTIIADAVTSDGATHHSIYVWDTRSYKKGACWSGTHPTRNLPHGRLPAGCIHYADSDGCNPYLSAQHHWGTQYWYEHHQHMCLAKYVCQLLFDNGIEVVNARQQMPPPPPAHQPPPVDQVPRPITFRPQAPPQVNPQAATQAPPQAATQAPPRADTQAPPRAAPPSAPAAQLACDIDKRLWPGAAAAGWTIDHGPPPKYNHRYISPDKIICTSKAEARAQAGRHVDPPGWVMRIL